MKEEGSPHVYGGSDDSNRQPPPSEGLRGEASAGQDDQHVRTADGVTISEASGTAAAEAAESEKER